MVSPTGIAAMCGEPMLLCKLQDVKEAAQVTCRDKQGWKLTTEIVEVGIGNGFEKQQEEVWMKELHSQKT